MIMDKRLASADLITLDRIGTLHPAIRKIVLELYLQLNYYFLGSGVRLRFAWTFRTAFEQNTLANKRPKVTNAWAWQSIHNYGLAFDIVLLYDKNGDGIFEEASWDLRRDGDNDGVADWLECITWFESNGFQNGFIRNGKKWDRPHFQMDFGMGWREMKAKIDAGDYDTEVVHGVTYKWIRISDELMEAA